MCRSPRRRPEIRIYVAVDSRQYCYPESRRVGGLTCSMYCRHQARDAPNTRLTTAATLVA
jgi:hypothetical protein